MPPECSDHFRMPSSLIFNIQLGTKSNRCHLENPPLIPSSSLLPLPHPTLCSPVYNLLLIFQLSLNLPQVHSSVSLPPKSQPQKLEEKNTLIDSSLLNKPVILKVCSSIFWELVRNADSQVPLRPNQSETQVTGPSGDTQSSLSDCYSSLRDSSELPPQGSLPSLFPAAFRCLFSGFLESLLSAILLQLFYRSMTSM